MSNQSGFAQMLVLVLLLTGIGLGIYLVRQRTNLLPQAQENNQCEDLPVYCEDGKTRQCTGGYFDIESNECKRSCEAVEGDPLNCGGDESKSSEGKKCEDKKYYCDYNKDPGGKRIFKTGGYFTNDPNDPLYGERDSEGCVYDFQDTKQACDGSEEVVGTPPGGSSNGGTSDDSPGIGTGDSKGQSLACQETKAVNSYYDSKVATNLMHYYAIIKGTPETCVKADLGLAPHMYAHELNDGDDERRLFLCSGKDGSIKWRVVSGDGSSLAQTREEFSKDINDLPNKENVRKAEEMLKVSL